MRYCTIDSCNKPLRARGMCSTHYTRWRSAKIPKVLRRMQHPIDIWIWDKINLSEYCWEWHTKGADGYGKVRYLGKSYLAHRFVYAYFLGNIEDYLVLDHLCQNKCCVNPYHLEKVEQWENIRRYHSKEDYRSEL